MSNTVTLYPMLSALQLALKFGNSLSDYQAVNDLQQIFLDRYFQFYPELSQFSEKELQSIANNDAEVINTFLRERGFSITLDPFTSPTDFGTASVMRVAVEWKTPGVAKEIQTQGNTYPGVFLKDATFTRSTSHPYPIASLICSNGDTVHLTCAAQVYAGFDLEQKIKVISNSQKSCHDFSGLHFPMVDLDQELDLNFFKGMHFLGSVFGEMEVSQAKQQTKFKMNQLGAVAESATAFGVRLCSDMAPKPNLVIDQEFLVWITRPNMSLPIFAGYITQEDWKDPGGI